jgi:arabinofuranan 3-O-arabinosyltransferase
VTVHAWNGFGPVQTSLIQQADGAPQPMPHTPALSANDGARLILDLDESDDVRVLAMTQNANQGWRATLDGTELVGQVVDGSRQGFVVPPGVSGTVVIEFAPNDLYRVLLALGLLSGGVVAAAAAVAALATSRGRRRQDAPPTESSRWSSLGALAGGVAVGGVLAGGVGVLAVGVGTWLGRHLPGGVRAVLAAALIIAAGIAHAVISPGGPGPRWLEGGVRLVLIVSLALALAALPRGKTGRQP